MKHQILNAYVCLYSMFQIQLQGELRNLKDISYVVERLEDGNNENC